MHGPNKLKSAHSIGDSAPFILLQAAQCPGYKNTQISCQELTKSTNFQFGAQLTWIEIKRIKSCGSSKQILLDKMAQILTLQGLWQTYPPC